jgi:hypothetical protein
VDSEPISRTESPVRLAGPLVGHARAVAVQHGPAAPAHQTHELVVAPALAAPPMSKGVPEHVRMESFDTGLTSARCDDTGDACVVQRAFATKPEPGETGVGMAGPGGEGAVG